MTTLSRSRFLEIAAAGAFVALSASLPARADELAQNLGPVGPHELFSRQLAVSASSRSTSRVVAIAPSTSWCGTVAMTVAIRRRASGSA
jgi:hypothetical protein